MNYKIGSKIIKIPDIEIEKSMKILGISKNDAIQMYLEDEGFLQNEEQEALEKKAKENHITATIHEARTNVKKTQKERIKKEDPTKEKIITECVETIKQFTKNVEIINKTKLISFELDGENYELNLIRKRKTK